MRGRIPGSVKLVTRNQKIVEKKHVDRKMSSGGEARTCGAEKCKEWVGRGVPAIIWGREGAAGGAAARPLDCTHDGHAPHVVEQANYAKDSAPRA